MIELVAAYMNDNDDTCGGFLWGHVSEATKSRYLHLARLAVEAIQNQHKHSNDRDIDIDDGV